MNKSLNSFYIFCATIGLSVVAGPASATSVDSSAHALSVDIDVAGLAGIQVGPLSAVAGNAAPAYNLSSSLATVDQSLTLFALPLITAKQELDTGLLVSTASSTFPGTVAGDASATINRLSTAFQLDPLIGPTLTLLGLSANTIRSTSAVSAAGGLSATGMTTIEGLTLTGLSLGGLTINGSLFVNPNPNTVLVDLLGLRIILNEQILSGDGIESAGIETNAIRLTFTNFALGTGLLDGDIILGHSQAAIRDYMPPTTAVPEPATWAMMIGGFGLVGGAMRRRERIVALA